MSWARRLKRVFGIEIEQCVRRGGRLKVIASVGEPELIERILAHRREWGEEGTPMASLGMRRILVVGYPNSGNTWLTRLTAELLAAPVRGFWGEPESIEIAVEGAWRSLASTTARDGRGRVEVDRLGRKQRSPREQPPELLQVLLITCTGEDFHSNGIARRDSRGK